MATTRKEFVSLYLEMQGLDKKGNALKDGALDKETVKEQFIENVVTNLSKLYAQIELAKEFDLITEEEAEKIVDSAKAIENTSKNRKADFIQRMRAEIFSVVGVKVEGNKPKKESKWF